jgi:hypothetical protein
VPVAQTGYSAVSSRAPGAETLVYAAFDGGSRVHEQRSACAWCVWSQDLVINSALTISRCQAPNLRQWIAAIRACGTGRPPVLLEHFRRDRNSAAAASCNWIMDASSADPLCLRQPVRRVDRAPVALHVSFCASDAILRGDRRKQQARRTHVRRVLCGQVLKYDLCRWSMTLVSSWSLAPTVCARLRFVPMRVNRAVSWSSGFPTSALRRLSSSGPVASYRLSHCVRLCVQWLARIRGFSGR